MIKGYMGLLFFKLYFYFKKYIVILTIVKITNKKIICLIQASQQHLITVLKLRARHQ